MSYIAGEVSNRGRRWDNKTGVYVTHLGQPPRRVPSRIPCPYCKGPMTRVTNCVGRIISSDNNTQVVVDELPKGYTVHGCQECKANFTLPPKGGEYGG